MSNHQQKRRGNHPSPHRGKENQSHQRGRKDPSHLVGVTGGDPGPGPLQRRRDQGQGSATSFFLFIRIFWDENSNIKFCH